MKLLVTGALKCTKEQLDNLEDMGNEVIFMQNEHDALPCDVESIEGVVCNGLFLHHSIEEFKSLKYIQLTSAGFDRVPMEYINGHNIVIYNARGVYSIPMAEFAICGVLQLLKKSNDFMQSQKEHIWKKEREILELFEKTVCIVGCGSVGTECAKRFKAFGCKVVGVDLFPKDDENFENIYDLDKLEDVLKMSDVIVLALPLTERTKHLMNSRTIACMKSNAILVNIARGMIVNTYDMIDAMKNKKILGAVLDVFEEEPLDNITELWDMDNVIITPHNSFVGEGNSERLWTVIKNNLEKFV